MFFQRYPRSLRPVIQALIFTVESSLKTVAVFPKIMQYTSKRCFLCTPTFPHKRLRRS